MISDLIGPQCPLWQEWLRDLRHDFYHLPEYVESCATLYPGGIPVAFIAKEGNARFLIPLILRPIESSLARGPLFDAVGPYGYASPLAVSRNDDPANFVERSLQALIKRLQHDHVVTLFCRLHPILAIPIEPLKHFGTVVEHGETVLCDLTCSWEELWRATRDSTRRKIKRVIAAGYRVGVDEQWESITDFCEMYSQTMERVKASNFYFFDKNFISTLRDRLRTHLYLIVARFDGLPVSSAIVSETCGIVQYHLSGTRSGFEHSDIAKLVLHFAREWAKQRGNEIFHLGGGVGAASDSLFQFKSGFSKRRGTFRTWRLIIDRHSYHQLLASRRHESPSLARGASGFFPEYRFEPQSAAETQSSLPCEKPKAFEPVS